jgi:hypothetical protein
MFCIDSTCNKYTVLCNSLKHHLNWLRRVRPYILQAGPLLRHHVVVVVVAPRSMLRVLRLLLATVKKVPP